ncbi:MAG: hypothetical protein Kow0077_06680 [Anaerolineae bacterium]
MNILGIGPTELVIVLLIMLMVAGPKRMARWAYVMGVYMAKLRAMWEETSTVIKKELAEAGVEPEVVETLGQMANPRTRRAAVSSQLDGLVADFKRPVEESLKPVEAALKEVGSVTIEESAAPNSRASNKATDNRPAESESTAPESDDEPAGRYDAWTPS